MIPEPGTEELAGLPKVVFSKRLKHPTSLQGTLVRLRLATEEDLDRIVEIRSSVEVFSRWAGGDLRREFLDDLVAEDLTLLVIVGKHGQVIGAIQWHEETDPMYRHAGLDLYVDPAHHRRGHGSDAVATLVDYLINTVKHHRLVIDPAADNTPAIACYSKVGFRPVGRMRRYEQALDGSWHDGLLMDLLAEDFINPNNCS